MLLPGRVYIALGPWHFGDFCKIFLSSIGEDRKKSYDLSAGLLAGTAPYYGQSDQGRRQLREIEGGDKIKIGRAKVFADFRRLFLAEILTFFFPAKSRLSPKKKKKVFAEIRRLFLTEITNFNVFSGQK